MNELGVLLSLIGYRPRLCLYTNLSMRISRSDVTRHQTANKKNNTKITYFTLFKRTSLNCVKWKDIPRCSSIS